MKLLHLLAHLELWPFGADAGDGESADGMLHPDSSHARRPIVLPEELRPVVVVARWPTEYARRTMH